ncbi:MULTISPECIES: gluconate:H+ symporter [unclassified Actinopolyspora]|uniref:GntP family permease n=1 Tax=unclassified Actinopolyspora TaxID=2639451 RepID=UPI0013F65422|nr:MULTISPECIES: gluconate:H+ symporter [unclassified Actinopolyspora]NHD18703.1 TRAP transporter large permease subunit [Actinopolyspora sp. BKK2]NHE77975.1 TRAP transporter large permease subunit [Actinopolyspora sp. BKK1]
MESCGACSPLTAGDGSANSGSGAELAWQLPDWGLLLLLAAGIVALLVLVTRMKMHAFVALLLVSVLVGFGAGIRPGKIPEILQSGMGETLGDIAIVVALGAILGRMMQESGADQVLSRGMLTAFGEKRAPLAVGTTALVFGIPVFFDVGFIILVPLIYAVATRSGRSPVTIALPAIGGLAMMHAVLPPHPGPVAAAGLLGADLGWVALMGLICGLPAWFVGAYLFGSRMGDRLAPVERTAGGDAESGSSEGGEQHGSAERRLPGDEHGSAGTDTGVRPPSLGVTVAIIVLPVLLILLNTFSELLFEPGALRETMKFIGAPTTALMVTVLLSFWLLGLRGGFDMARIEKAASASLGPVALVLLVTGAGGVFGAVLEATGAGDALADLLGATSLPVVVLAFLIATALRVALGSKTVAIVTTAPIVAPLIQQMGMSQPEIALVVVAVASGGTVLSHVNDSGFWLFNRYMDLDIKTTLKTWTLMETFMGTVAFLAAALGSAVLAVV